MLMGIPLSRSGSSGEVAKEPHYVVKVIEQGREEERLGDDPPVRYDNRSSGIEQSYELKASRQWRRQITVNLEEVHNRTRTVGGGLNLPHMTAKIEQAVTQSLKESYSALEEKVESFEQTIKLTVPARTLVLVTLSWKRIWQLGEVNVTVDGESFAIPYRTLAGVAFDVLTTSEASTT